MKNTDLDRPENNLLDPKRARAWIITLALGIGVCLVAIAYSLITHNPAVSFIDTLYVNQG